MGRPLWYSSEARRTLGFVLIVILFRPIRGDEMEIPFQKRRPSRCERRTFLRIGGGLAIADVLWPFLTPRCSAQALPAVAPPSSSKAARSCILVYLLGGPPHLDMWDLKPDAPAEVRGPFRPLATSLPGVQTWYRGDHF